MLPHARRGGATVELWTDFIGQDHWQTCHTQLTKTNKNYHHSSLDPHPCVVLGASADETASAFVQGSLASSVVSGPRQQRRARRTNTTPRGISFVAKTPRYPCSPKAWSASGRGGSRGIGDCLLATVSTDMRAPKKKIAFLRAHAYWWFPPRVNWV